MRLFLAALSFCTLAMLAALPACSCNTKPGATPECTGGTDLDGDHYGANCPAGPDCNDNDPGVHDDCCASGIYQGCPCNPGVDTQIPCYDGPPTTSGTPPCTRGVRSCNPAVGLWDACIGQVLPQDEVCNGSDDNCDGSIDEGVMSTCGNCLPGCADDGVDTDPFPCTAQNPAIECDGVGTDPNGDLVLDSSTIVNHYLWIANDHAGTVTKLDTRTGYEVARYASVTHARVVNHTGNNFPAYDAGTAGGGYASNRPSRTAVDFYGDVWVANRAPDAQPSITKILNSPTDCVDYDGDGVLETSRDANGDRVIDPADPAEFFGEADECIKFTVVVGAINSWQARALAIDAGMPVMGQRNPGNVWVGMFTEQAFYQVNGETGALMQRVPATGTFQAALGVPVNPYGAAVDGQGRLWAPSNCCGGVYLTQINTAQNPATFARTAMQSGGGSYGITIDLMDRVWLGGWPTNAMFRYTPATDSWTTATVTGPGWGVRGVGIDTRGNVWGAVHGTGAGYPGSRLTRVDASTAMETGVWDMPGQRTPTGAGVDFDGDVWAINQGVDGQLATSTASRLHIDSVTGQPAAHPTTNNIVDTFPVGLNPYTYSDFTGLGLRTVTRPSGEYVVPIQGCMNGEAAQWLRINWMATEPPGTEVEVYVRAGNDLATLNQAPLFGPWTVSPADLQQPPGPVPDARYLLLIIRLISQDRESTPIVHSYNVEWSCPCDVPG
jgi:streptogramin lyase